MSNNFYEVKKGDTLWSICKKEFNLTSNREIANKVAEIQKVNSIFGDQIDVGQKINLGVDNKVSNNTTKAPEQPVTKQAETKETVAPTNTQANQETTPKKETFVQTFKNLWSNITTFGKEAPEMIPSYSGDMLISNNYVDSPEVIEEKRIAIENERKKVAEEKANAIPEWEGPKTLVVDPEKVPLEERVPDGYKLAPNGKVTKIYTIAEINEIAEEMAEKYHVDSLTVKAIIQTESSYGQFAVSNREAQGLMQLTPKGGGKGLENAFDARQNIEQGVKEFVRLRRYYGNDHDAHCAYNCGEGNYNSYLMGGEDSYELKEETLRYNDKIKGHKNSPSIYMRTKSSRA